MALIDKFSGASPNHTGELSATLFTSYGVLVAQGIMTKQKLIDDLALTAEDQVQLDQLVAYYTGLTADLKNKFFSKLQALLFLLESGNIDDTFFKANLGLS